MVIIVFVEMLQGSKNLFSSLSSFVFLKWSISHWL